MKDNRSESNETRYCINGFRSLINFEIGLNRGLNVLVGPNGSGKTNFIDFLDFLSTTILQSASTAVSQAGGVARVFSQEQAKNKVSSITAQVCGIADLEGYVEEDTPYKLFNFDYEIEIDFSRTQSVIFVSRESIRFHGLRKASEPISSRSIVGNMQIRRRAISLHEAPTFEISPRLQTQRGRNPMKFHSTYLKLFPESENNKYDSMSVGADESILSSRRRYPAIDAVRTAITRGRSFNLVPNRVRNPDDLTRAPSISADGSGLTSTLYHLQRAQHPAK